MSRISIIGMMILLVAVTGCTLFEDSSPNQSPYDSAGAREFSLTIVASYFSGDASVMDDAMADTLYTLEGDGPFGPDDVDTGTPYPFGDDYTNYTMDDYNSTYDPRIQNENQWRQNYDWINELEFSDGWAPDGDDYLFLGWIEQSGETGFMWDDLLVFMITDQSGDWELVAFGS